METIINILILIFTPILWILDLVDRLFRKVFEDIVDLNLRWDEIKNDPVKFEKWYKRFCVALGVFILTVSTLYLQTYAEIQKENQKDFRIEVTQEYTKAIEEDDRPYVDENENFKPLLAKIDLAYEQYGKYTCMKKTTRKDTESLRKEYVDRDVIEKHSVPNSECISAKAKGWEALALKSND